MNKNIIFALVGVAAVYLFMKSRANVIGAQQTTSVTTATGMTSPQVTGAVNGAVSSIVGSAGNWLTGLIDGSTTSVPVADPALALAATN